MTPLPGKRPLRGKPKHPADPVKLTKGEKERRERLDAVVRAATAWWYRGVEMRAPILCVRPWRRGMRSCCQRLRLLLESPDGPIRHKCEGCCHVGWIEGWQGGDLDLSGIDVPGDGTWIEAVLAGCHQRDLLKICADDPEAVRVLAAAFALDCEAVVAGPRRVLEKIQAQLAKAIRKTRSERRTKYYTFIWRRLDWALAKPS